MLHYLIVCAGASTALSPKFHSTLIFREIVDVDRLTSRHLGLLMGAKLGRVQNAHAINLTAPTHGHFVLSPVLLASGAQDGGPSNSTIHIVLFV